MKRILFAAIALLLFTGAAYGQADVLAGQDMQPELIASVDAVAPVAVAVVALPAAPVVPETIDLGEAIANLIGAVGDGQTAGLVAAAIFLLLGLLRWKPIKSFLTRFLPMRWFSVLAVFLGVLWGCLAGVETLGWWGAIQQGLIAGGGAVTLYEVICRAIAGKDAKEKAKLNAALGDPEKLKELLK